MKISKGLRFKLTTTTAGAEVREIVTFRRLANGTQVVVHASPAAAEKVRSGQIDDVKAYIAGLADVRRMDTQDFHERIAAGRITAV